MYCYPQGYTLNVGWNKRSQRRVSDIYTTAPGSKKLDCNLDLVWKAISWSVLTDDFT